MIVLWQEPVVDHQVGQQQGVVDHDHVGRVGVGALDASSLSYDHAVPYDPLAAERIEVVRGPAAVLYGGNAVGGVVNVIDLMKVKPRVVASDVQKRIREALQRHVDVEASKITVSVADGTVTLAGTVDSVAEMDRIEDAAWTAPGVTKVVDNLRVA